MDYKQNEFLITFYITLKATKLKYPIKLKALNDLSVCSIKIHKEIVYDLFLKLHKNSKLKLSPLSYEIKINFPMVPLVSKILKGL